MEKEDRRARLGSSIGYRDGEQIIGNLQALDSLLETLSRGDQVDEKYMDWNIGMAVRIFEMVDGYLTHFLYKDVIWHEFPRDHTGTIDPWLRGAAKDALSYGGSDAVNDRRLFLPRDAQQQLTSSLRKVIYCLKYLLRGYPVERRGVTVFLPLMNELMADIMDSFTSAPIRGFVGWPRIF